LVDRHSLDSVRNFRHLFRLLIVLCFRHFVIVREVKDVLVNSEYDEFTDNQNLEIFFSSQELLVLVNVEEYSTQVVHFYIFVLQRNDILLLLYFEVRFCLWALLFLRVF